MSEKPKIILPRGWELAEFRDLFEGLQYGYTASAIEDTLAPRLLRITDIQNGSVNWTTVPGCAIEDAVRPRYLLADGDFVFARTGSIEKAWRVRNPPPAVFASYLIRGRLRDSRLSDWMRYFVESSDYVGQAVKASAGIGRPNVNAQNLGRFQIRISPIPEQRKIIAILESLFPQLDAAVAALERVRANLKRYRASVLKAAVEGRLVPTEAELARREGHDFEPASVLLGLLLKERRRRWEESELARMKAAGRLPKDERWKSKYHEPAAPDMNTLPQLPEGWCWVTLDQLICEPLANGRSVPTDPNGFPVLRLTALKGNVIDLSERKGGAWTPEAANPFLVARGDFLVARGNGSIRLVGWGGLVDGEPDPVAFPDTLVRVRLANDSVLPKLLAHVWNSRWVRDQIEHKAKTTAGIHKVNQTDLSLCVLPMPPILEQKRILSELEKLTSVAGIIDQTLEGSAARCCRLRQSVLKWAFEGRLVDQDPSDEPASVLLERIRAERATAMPSTKSRKLGVHVIEAAK